LDAIRKEAVPARSHPGPCSGLGWGAVGPYAPQRSRPLPPHAKQRLDGRRPGDVPVPRQV